VSGRLISKLRRYLPTSSNNDSTENYISVLRYWPSPLSLSSLLFPTLFQWLSCDPSLALPMLPSFSHSISPGVCSPSLQHIHMHTQYTQHTRARARSGHFCCCQNRKFGNTGARLIRAGSHETTRADSPILLARPHLSASGEIERRAEDISRGFDPRVDESWSLPPTLSLPPRGFLRLMERGRMI